MKPIKLKNWVENGVKNWVKNWVENGVKNLVKIFWNKNIIQLCKKKM